jgi:hypothetical protein
VISGERHDPQPRSKVRAVATATAEERTSNPSAVVAEERRRTAGSDVYPHNSAFLKGDGSKAESGVQHVVRVRILARNEARHGTSRREDLLDVVINLRHPADYNPAEGLRCEVHYEKCRGFYGEDAKPFEVKMEQGQGGEAVWTKRDLENVLEAAAAALFEDGASVRDVAQDLGISTAMAGRIRTRRRREPGDES